jgi:hypothetical protein
MFSDVSEKREVKVDRRLVGPQSQSGRCGEEKVLDPTGTPASILRSSSS